MLVYVRRFQTEFIAFITFVISGLISYWVNLTTPGFQILATHNALILVAFLLFITQYMLIRNEIGYPTKRHITDLLRIAAFQLAQTSGKSSNVEHIRGSFHVARKHKHKEYIGPVDCLCLVARFSLHEIQDTGAIDLNSSENRKWFFNVRAFHGRKGLAGDVDISWTPSCADGVASTLGLGIKGIISFRVIAGADVIGTVSFDSTMTTEDMKWIDGNNRINSNVEKIIVDIIAMIRRTYLKNWDE